MKKICLLLLPIILMGARCKKETIEINKLPQVTQTGANTFGALVNGKVFVPKVNFGSFTIQLQLTYTPNTQTALIIANNTTTVPSGSFVIVLDHIDFKAGDIIQLQRYMPGKTNATMAEYSEITGSVNNYDIIAPLSGTLKVLKFDTTQKIFSGTFSFEAMNSLGEKVSVTDGRFDLKYL